MIDIKKTPEGLSRLVTHGGMLRLSREWMGPKSAVGGVA
jgi:hypothetical protein